MKLKEYLDLNANYCPYCKSEEISGQEGEFEATVAYRNVSCESCNKTWTEEFTITGVTELTE